MAIIEGITIVFGLLGQYVTGSPLSSHSSEALPRIVGGIDAPKGFAPHMMALVTGESISTLTCGASIISDSHILTAAHCIDVFITWGGVLIPSLRGVYGSNEWDSTEKQVKFKHYINHGSWNAFAMKNDIGVLFIEGKLSMVGNVAVIPLNFDWVDAGEKTYVTGWGRISHSGPTPTKLQLIYVETIDEKTCRDGVREASTSWWPPQVNQSIEICTLHPKGSGFGMCTGDSGSALVSAESGQQAGIVSWGFPCALGAPDMFVRISGFKDWLLDILNDCEDS